MIRHAMLMMVVVLLAVSLTGCGGDDDDDDATDSSGTTATTGTTSDAAGTEGVADSLYTTAELERFGTDLVTAVASGDKDALTATLSGVVPQSRIDELAACKPADLETSNVFVSVIVEPPVMKMSGTVDVTTGGDTQTKVVNWQTELSEVSPGVYTFSSLGEGCPFIFQ